MNKNFIIALENLFVSKGKEIPSAGVARVWYNLLSRYNEADVILAMRELCEEPTMGIQTAYVIEKLKVDYKELAESTFNDVIMESIKLGHKLSTNFINENGLSYSLLEDLRRANSFQINEIKKIFIKNHANYLKKVNTKKAIDNKEQKELN